MAKTIPIPVPTPPERLQAVDTALAPLREQLTALDREHRAAWRVGGYTNMFTDQPIVDAAEEEIILARARLQEIPLERRRLRARMLPLERQQRELIDQIAREQREGARVRQHAEAVPEVDAAIAHAVEVVQRHLSSDDEAGTGAVGAWAFLAPRLAEWRTWCAREL